jgi:teichuronic acid biosynthesis glycosyltransferase TuaG
MLLGISMHEENTFASDKPLVSVIMPAYNVSSTIAQSIESVRNQAYSNWELIVVNDFSADETAEIVKKYFSDPRIKMIHNAKNCGLP